MGWFAVVRIVLELASRLVRVLGDRQLLEAGEARYAAENIAEAHRLVVQAQAARRRVAHDPDGVRDDRWNRDRRD